MRFDFQVIITIAALIYIFRSLLVAVDAVSQHLEEQRKYLATPVQKPKPFNPDALKVLSRSDRF